MAVARTTNLQTRLVDVWTWLPAFRAVAEVEHVQNAARALHIAPSALSRSIRLLEEHLEMVLFERVGRNVRLNHNGTVLLAAVRDGMRRIDDGLAQVTGTVFSGELRVACEGDLPLAFVWRVATRLMREHDQLTTTVEQITPKVAARLLRGELDLAIVTSPPQNTRLLVEYLGDVTYGIYCGEGHPLHKARGHLSMDTIRTHAFVAPTIGGRGESGDGGGEEHDVSDQWPPEIDRLITLRLPALEPAVAVCASGALLAVLPDIAAMDPDGDGGGGGDDTRAHRVKPSSLRRLPSDAIPPSPLFAVRRRPTHGDVVSRADAFVTELRSLCSSASSLFLLGRKTRGVRRKSIHRSRK